MTAGTTSIYRFSGFELDTAERTLKHGDESLLMAPRVFDTLKMLVENCGHVLGKEQMLSEIWEGSFVEENNLAQNISLIRKVLAKRDGGSFIETVPKFGYRFVAVLESDGHGSSREVGAASPVPAATSFAASKPETSYVRSGDVNIAYQVAGTGAIDIVFVMGWVSHLEYFWEEPHFAAFLNRLASFSRLILFDKRGTGLSDRVPLAELPTLEQRMEDVHAVMDAVGSERAVLIGVSEGGPMCSLFAATHPERTAALVMIGSYAKRVRDEDYPWGISPDDRDAFYQLMQRDWGKPVGIEERAPSLAGDAQFREWWATYLRMGASPGAAVALTKMNSEIDVRSVLPSIRVPTLVIHRKGDMCLKLEEGRYLASLIANAKFVELDGIDHLPFVGEQDEILDEIERFVSGVAPLGVHDRVLATILSVKLAESGDAAARKAAEDSIRRHLALFNGQEIADASGSILAAFNGPARAIRCAAAIEAAVSYFGFSIRSGLHTGECDVEDGQYSGYAVELSKLIADESDADGMLVSRTVKDLAAGSGISFVDQGVRSFDGIEGEWRLFSVAS